MESNYEKRYYEAKERVKELKDFYIHLIVYVLVIGFLAVINFGFSNTNYPWFLWPAAGWGIGIAFQAASVFRINPFFDKRWEEKKVQQYLQEEEEKEVQQRWE
ncbi:2TM domain-containing protein [Mesonia maritima]|uniref:2TM domain-containing protein n=1 Tax=Mesonia maritima TaxID=1793873 RepID=A0ABU1K5F7_9FLAO|nr:2TM domain-containing protein [Mesonia maritima]MDR6300844.1 hypothetical protein [Mesonia maritima]